MLSDRNFWHSWEAEQNFHDDKRSSFLVWPAKSFVTSSVHDGQNIERRRIVIKVVVHWKRKVELQERWKHLTKLKIKRASLIELQWKPLIVIRFKKSHSLLSTWYNWSSIGIIRLMWSKMLGPKVITLIGFCFTKFIFTWTENGSRLSADICGLSSRCSSTFTLTWKICF